MSELDPTPAPAPASRASGASLEGAAARCTCGHDRHHTMVSPEKNYTAWGGFWVFFFGVSYTPVRVDFRCRVCGEAFDHTEDPDLLGKYV